MPFNFIFVQEQCGQVIVFVFYIILHFSYLLFFYSILFVTRVPYWFISSDVIPNNKSLYVPNANLYIFGILNFNVHMAWIKTVAGRLESRYSYGATTVYNTFPWCLPTAEQKAKIEKTAQAILDAREKYSDCTLAQLYGDKAYLFTELVKAHRENDAAVMKAYGFDKTREHAPLSKKEIVAQLFKMYEKLVQES